MVSEVMGEQLPNTKFILLCTQNVHLPNRATHTITIQRVLLFILGNDFRLYLEQDEITVYLATCAVCI